MTERAPPLLSIVMYYILPAPFLAQAIDSVLSQWDERVELVVVAGLPAGSDIAIAEAQRARIDQLIVEPDQGAWDAANKGWRAARGTWVQFLMSDDLIPSGAIAKTLAGLADAPEDIATGNLTFFRDTLHGRRATRHAQAAPLTLTRALGDLCSPATLYRRALLQRLGGFDGRYRYAHDRDLLLRAYFAGARHRILAHDTCWMRDHPGSRTLSGDRAVKCAYLADHQAMADAALASLSMTSDSTRRLRLWREEEAFKFALLQGKTAALSTSQRIAAAGRIGVRKLWWKTKLAFDRLGRNRRRPLA